MSRCKDSLVSVTSHSNLQLLGEHLKGKGNQVKWAKVDSFGFSPMNLSHFQNALSDGKKSMRVAQFNSAGNFTVLCRCFM